MMRRVAVLLGFMGVMASFLDAQQVPRTPIPNELYCNGIVTSDPVPTDTYVITGEESSFNIIYSQDQLVFLNKGASQGVKVGDEFQVMRPTPADPLHREWFQSQDKLLKSMGTTYEDEARIRVVNVQPNTATAQVVFSCNYIQRGDIVQRFAERPAPMLRSEEGFDIFAPPSGKSTGVMVTTRYFGQTAANGTIVYVNLGSTQSVNVGDYLRVFRYQGNSSETVYQTPRVEYQIYGLGSTPRPYTGAEVPRDILGEGVVLRVSKNAATVLITVSKKQMYVGDYVELE
jgi:Flagellar assembly protein T, C-terminal domain